MSFRRHRRPEGSNLDFLYDSDYSAPSDTDMVKARKTARTNLAPVKTQTKFDAMFEDVPRSKGLEFQLNNLSRLRKRKTDTDSVSSGTDDISLRSQRLRGGANNPNERKVTNVVITPSECKSKPPGFHHFTPCPNVNIIDIKLSESKTKTNGLPFLHCSQYDDRRKTKRKATCGTQTLYRESSAQTLPYLPDVSNKENELDFEIFKLPKILPGDGPPTVYEVEVLERARKRWQFASALKEHFKQQLKEATEQARLHKHKHILAAFEWEYWIEREEHIQECQMMRLELLIRMFDKREREMHEASKRRIEQSCEQIEARRKAALHKNNIEFGRQMRRLEIGHMKIPRNWRKENIVSQLGSPKSEFYAPQQRYGVNPSRRHFRGGRKAFEARIDDLEKKVATTGRLVCPFAKLKEWSAPKQRMMEVEQNFCSDDNLRKMYDSLMGLRQQSMKQKLKPKCLVQRFTPWTFVNRSTLPSAFIQSAPAAAPEPVAEEELDEQAQELKRQEHEEFRRKAHEKKRRTQYLQEQYQQEEIESMLAEYEGTTIGWLMRFLSEEMNRLQEQRILHFITMLAQKERWRREAAEAGLRQKENEMREIYEQLYMDTQGANAEVCKEYLSSILNVDIADYADQTATTCVTNLAKTIDRDIQRWLNSLAGIQNPLNFDTLRSTLKDIIFPDMDTILRKQEAEGVLKYIMEDVLFANVFKLLEPYDVGFSIANETVDRLIDNDLYYFSPDCSSDCFCTDCKCAVVEKEAKAVVRKAIRYAVPGRRWRTETERIADENVNDILNDVFETLVQKGSLYESDSVYEFCELARQRSFLNLLKPSWDTYTASTESSELVPEFSQPNRVIHQRTAGRKKYIHEGRYENKSHDTIGAASEVNPREVAPEDHPAEFAAEETIGGQTPRNLLPNIIQEIISKFIPHEDGYSSDAVSEPCDATGIITKVVKEIYAEEAARDFDMESDEGQAEGQGEIVDDIYQHDSEEDDEYQLVMNDNELELIERDICKYTAEEQQQRDEYVKKLLKDGKVKVIRKSKRIFGRDAEGHDPVEVFEYDSDTENVDAALSDLMGTLTGEATAPNDLEVRVDPNTTTITHRTESPKGHINFADEDTHPLRLSEYGSDTENVDAPLSDLMGTLTGEATAPNDLEVRADPNTTTNTHNTESPTGHISIAEVADEDEDTQRIPAGAEVSETIQQAEDLEDAQN